MSTLFAGPVDSAYRRPVTRSKVGTRVNSGDLFEVIMDSVATRLASRRLFSVLTINELNGQIVRAERTVITADLKSSLIAVWKALLGVAERPTTSHWRARRRHTPGYEEVLTRIDQRCTFHATTMKFQYFGKHPGSMEEAYLPPVTISYTKFQPRLRQGEGFLFKRL